MDSERSHSLDLFSQENVHTMVRYNSVRTEVLAAASVAPKRSALKAAIVQAFRELGPMTDEQLEQLPQFAFPKYAPSTIRKRRSELCDPTFCGGQPVLESRGPVDRPGRTPMTLWALVAQEDPCIR